MELYRTLSNAINRFQTLSNFVKHWHTLSNAVERFKEPGWTSGIHNFLQTFDIDLGSIHKLTSIDTLGRQLTNEFVSEFRLLTSSDGVHWREYLVDGIEKAIFPTNFQTIIFFYLFSCF